MSEQEFELYLKLLSRCLNLTSGQREQIADELRDHLEERLEELARAGVPREKAVVQALDEFGDAAVLAAHFTTIARLKRRRFLMRLSLGSVGALTAALLISFAFWPDNRAVRGPERIVAQEKPKAGNSKPEKSGGTSALARPATSVATPDTEHPWSSDEHSKSESRIEEALNQQVDFNIEPQSLKEAIEFIGARYQIPILFDHKALDDANVATSTEVKASLPGIPLHDLLTLLLRQLSQPVGYEISNGILMISTIERISGHREVVVYDCRDLVQVGTLDRYPVQKLEANSGATSGGLFQVPQEPPKPAAAPQAAPPKPGLNLGGGASPQHKPASPPAASGALDSRRLPLIQTLIAATDPEAWDEGATISEFGGLLVVRQNSFVHAQIKRLLVDIRRMRTAGAFASFANDYEAELKRRGTEPAPAHQSGTMTVPRAAVWTPAVPAADPTRSWQPSNANPAR
jgi:hypothetical protein